MPIYGTVGDGLFVVSGREMTPRQSSMRLDVSMGSSVANYGYAHQCSLITHWVNIRTPALPVVGSQLVTSLDRGIVREGRRKNVKRILSADVLLYQAPRPNSRRGRGAERQAILDAGNPAAQNRRSHSRTDLWLKTRKKSESPRRQRRPLTRTRRSPSGSLA